MILGFIFNLISLVMLFFFIKFSIKLVKYKRQSSLDQKGRSEYYSLLTAGGILGISIAASSALSVLFYLNDISQTIN